MPVVIIKISIAEIIRLNGSSCAKHTIDKRFCAHFKREDCNRHVRVDSNVFGNVQNKCRFPDGRTRCQNNQVVRLKPRNHFIEVFVTS